MVKRDWQVALFLDSHIHVSPVSLPEELGTQPPHSYTDKLHCNFRIMFLIVQPVGHILFFFAITLFVNLFPFSITSETAAEFLVHVTGYSTLQVQNSFHVREFTFRGQQLTYKRNIPMPPTPCILFALWYTYHNVTNPVHSTHSYT